MGKYKYYAPCILLKYRFESFLLAAQVLPLAPLLLRCRTLKLVILRRSSSSIQTFGPVESSQIKFSYLLQSQSQRRLYLRHLLRVHGLSRSHGVLLSQRLLITLFDPLLSYVCKTRLIPQLLRNLRIDVLSKDVLHTSLDMVHVYLAQYQQHLVNALTLLYLERYIHFSLQFLRLLKTCLKLLCCFVLIHLQLRLC